MHCKSYSHVFQQKKNQHIWVSLDVNFNKSLTNDIVNFEQLGPEEEIVFQWLSMKLLTLGRSGESVITNGKMHFRVLWRLCFVLSQRLPTVISGFVYSGLYRRGWLKTKTILMLSAQWCRGKRALSLFFTILWSNSGQKRDLTFYANCLINKSLW